MCWTPPNFSTDHFLIGRSTEQRTTGLRKTEKEKRAERGGLINLPITKPMGLGRELWMPEKRDQSTSHFYLKSKTTNIQLSKF